jgi:5-methylcytosine-specific restriction endonuclease McrA
MELPPPRPDILGTSWRLDYRLLGISREEIRRTGRALKNGAWRVRCHDCSQDIDLEAGVFAYLRRESVEDFFALRAHDGEQPPGWMRRALVKAYGYRCAGCRKDLSAGKSTMDHIEPRRLEGRTEFSNLQPLCGRCNLRKGGREVKVSDAWLTFLLRPPPSDGYEGVIW